MRLLPRPQCLAEHHAYGQPFNLSTFGVVLITFNRWRLWNVYDRSRERHHSFLFSIDLNITFIQLYQRRRLGPGFGEGVFAVPQISRRPPNCEILGTKVNEALILRRLGLYI